MKYFNLLKENFLLILILILGGFLRLYHLDFQSIWLDEIHTMIESCPELSFAEFKHIVIFREGMGHFYFYIARFLQEIFGVSTYIVRLFSAVIGIISIYSVYDLGKRLFNKNAGLIAAIFLAVNHFVIFYSQEARPYSLLILVVIFSFKRLVFFIRNPSLRNCLWYGFSAALIVNTHFVGLPTILSQYTLLFVIFLLTEKSGKLKILKYGLISFILTFILSWNTKEIFMKVISSKSTWQLPGEEGFKHIFYQFFGSTEMLTFIFTTLLIYFLFKVFNEKLIQYKLENILNNKLIFSTIILFTWIFLPILIPFIKSYTGDPMLINRYFISLIPPLLLAIGIGISLMKNKISQILIIMTVVFFALADLFLVKDYYNRINKTQFREIAAKVKEKNTSKSKIISSWGWHFDYFFNRGLDKQKVVDKPIPFQTFVNELMVIPDEKPFWYIAAHFQPYQLTPQSESFINSKYNVVENLEYFDCWARYYVPKSSADDIFVLDINKFSPVKSNNAENILMFSNSTTKSEPFMLDAGNYRIAIKTRSLPDPPVDEQNANIVIAVSGKEIGAFFASEKQEKVTYLPFTIKKKKNITVDLTFGNDLVIGQADRNILIFSVIIEKIKN